MFLFGRGFLVRISSPTEATVRVVPVTLSYGGTYLLYTHPCECFWGLCATCVARGRHAGRAAHRGRRPLPHGATAPYTLHPAPCTPHPAPCTLHPTTYTLNPTSYTPHTSPNTLHPTPYTLHPALHTLHPTPHIQHSALYTLHPSPYTMVAPLTEDDNLFRTMPP